MKSKTFLTATLVTWLLNPFCAPLAFSAEVLSMKVLPWTTAGEIFQINFSKDGRLAKTESTTSLGSNTTEQTIWDVATGNVIAKGLSSIDGDQSVDFMFFGNRAIKNETSKVGGHKVQKITNLETGEVLANLGDWEYLTQIVPGRKTTQLITIKSNTYGFDGITPVDDSVQIYDSASQKLIRTITLNGTLTGQGSSNQVISPDGRLLAYSTSGAGVLIDLMTGNVLKTVTGTSVATGLSDDGLRFYSYAKNPDESADLIIWNTSTVKPMDQRHLIPEKDEDGELINPLSWQNVVELTPGLLSFHKRLFTTGFFNLKTGALTVHARGGSMNRLEVEAVNDTTILSGRRYRSNPSNWRIETVVNGKFKTLYENQEVLALGSLHSSPNGKCLSWVNEKMIRFVDPITQEVLGKVESIPNDLYRGAFTVNGDGFVATGAQVVVFSTPKICQGK